MPPPPAPSSTTPVLTYDGHFAAKDPRARWVLPAYSAGLFTTGVVYAPIVCFFDRGERAISIFFDALAAPLAIGLILLLPNILFLGLCIWLRQKIIKEVRFARPRTAFLWGFLAGIFPLPLVRFLEFSDTMQIVFFLTGLAWHLVIPSIAGFFLCYRSHLRD